MGSGCFAEHGRVRESTTYGEGGGAAALRVPSCAYTYRPPTPPPQTFTAPLTDKRSDMFDAAKACVVASSKRET